VERRRLYRHHLSFGTNHRGVEAAHAELLAWQNREPRLFRDLKWASEDGRCTYHHLVVWLLERSDRRSRAEIRLALGSIAKRGEGFYVDVSTVDRREIRGRRRSARRRRNT
jgi:hypothetical protein